MILALWWSLLLHVTCTFGQSEDIDSSLQCIHNGECDDLHACIDLKCQNPCPGICHGNSTCRVHNHVAYCSCRPGLTGDPSTGCQEQEPTVCPTPQPTSGRKKFMVERFMTVNWYTAFVHCASHGGRLATVESKEDNDMIKEEIRKSEPYAQFWTSATSFAEGKWIWMTTGKPLSGFSDWRKGEPNNVNNDEHCMEFGWDIVENSGQKWNDINCLLNKHPVCEYFE